MFDVHNGGSTPSIFLLWSSLQFLAHCFDSRQNQFHKAGTFYPNSKLNHADITTLRCFNYSRNEWEVSDESVGVKITKWAGRKADVPSLPALLKVQPGMPGPTPSTDLVGAMHFAQGWLFAYDGSGSGGRIMAYEPRWKQNKTDNQ
jgi:hypothetical protein